MGRKTRSGRPAAEFAHRQFWRVFRERHPREPELRVRNGPWFWQRPMLDHGIVVSMYVAPARNLVGVFFGRNERIGAVRVDERLAALRPALIDRLGLRPDQLGDFDGFASVWRVNVFAEDNFAAMADWMVTESYRVEAAVRAILADAAA